MDIEFSRPLKIDHIDRQGSKKTIEATADECAALAQRFDLATLESCVADFNVMPQSGGNVFHVTGVVKAVAAQKSIVSGFSIERIIHQDIDAWYGQPANVTSFANAKKYREEKSEDTSVERELREEKDEPELIYNNEIDLGEIAAQFMGLALDDYPRAENENEGAGDYIEVKPEDAKPNPFAVLAQLKDKK